MAGLHPVESELRLVFPAVSIESNATFDRAESFVDGSLISGLRARGGVAAPALSVMHPDSYDGLIVAELGQQRVVLRPRHAAAAAAIESNGKLVYGNAYRSVDIVEVPRDGRSEELLLLRDDNAPRSFDYQIVAADGIAGVVLDEGAIRFLPTAAEERPASTTATGRFVPLPHALQIERPWVIDASGRRSETRARWMLIGAGPIPEAIRLAVDTEEMDFPAVIGPTFASSGSGIGRWAHTATLLPNGKVLVAGGENRGGRIGPADLYDPASGVMRATGSLITPREYHTATLLLDGTVLLAGGNGPYLSSAEIYDPQSGTFTATGSMATGRRFHTATLLPNGKVLIVGGSASLAATSAELYDPATRSFANTGSTAVGRRRHTATLLGNGKVLIAGGDGTDFNVTSAELYDPANGTFHVTGSLAVARADHTATLMANGKVLVTGGDGLHGVETTAEVYDPAGEGTFSPTGRLTYQHENATATLLPNGRVLVTGGGNWFTDAAFPGELYDPVGGTFTATDPMCRLRRYHTATLLPNGFVFIAGGFGPLGNYGDGELFDPTTPSFAATGSLRAARQSHTATLLPNGNVLVAGGFNGTDYLSSAELYDEAAGTFTATAGGLATRRKNATSTLLTNGKVLIAGGVNGTGLVAPAELYDPGSRTFTAAAKLITPRQGHTATLLAGGKVLITAGVGATGELASSEMYDPATESFSPTGSLATARTAHTATLLPSGKVLIAGGRNASAAFLASAELFDPFSGTFTGTGNLTQARHSHTATLLPNGRVLLAGGMGGEGPLPWGEFYYPWSGTFADAGTVGSSTGRYRHSATLLPTGSVLIAGGVGSDYLGWCSLFDDSLGLELIWGFFGVTASLNTPRELHTATVLPNGKVLIAGGSNGQSLSSAEVYDIGRGFEETRRPSITSAPESVTAPAPIAVAGSGFRGDSEGSAGGTNSSATNYPLLQLQRVDNEQIVFLPPVAPFSDTAFAGAPASYLPAGAYRATIVTNGIPSTARVLQVLQTTPAISTLSPDRGHASGGQSVVINGSNLQGVSVTIDGIAATVSQTTPTTATFVTPAHVPAVVGVRVSSPSGASTTIPGGFVYVPDPPTNVVATALTATSVRVSWTGSANATGYQVMRSSHLFDYEPVGESQSNVFTDFTAAENTAYLYAVRAFAYDHSDNSAPDLATTVVFTDGVLGGMAIKAVHLQEVRTAVLAVQTLAARPPATLTDPAIVAAVTPIKAAHILELRTALDAARGTLSFPQTGYTQWLLRSGFTVSAADVTDLRSRVK